MKHSFDTDPLTLAMAPPPDETQEERAAREEREERAREVSKRIDAEIKVAKAAMKKKQRAVKVLVLGQSMSGKSTTIKNFQMTYAQRAWIEERDSWKAVILLNLVQSVNIIVDVLVEELDIAQDIHSDPADRATLEARSSLSEKHISLTLKLAPLRQIERDLKSLLGSGAAENDVVLNSSPRNEGRNILHEFALHSSSGWRTVLDHVRNPTEGKAQQLQRVACNVISGLEDDILHLWKDEVVHIILRTRGIKLEDGPGFFLHDVERIARASYVPTDADVVRARLRTTGVQEYEFTLDKGTTALDWLMYDVAGVRTSRAAWIPYFKDITAIIFLAPLSAFNETLAEDPKINSIHDTFSLWTTICSSKLLANVQIILFMNKIDILQRKLDSGLQVRDYIPEYQETSNDFATVTKWFRRSFQHIYKTSSGTQRKLISHFTSVVDTKATAETLAGVQSAILRNDIIEAGLI